MANVEDIAHLGFDVDSSDAVSAVKDLGKLEAQAEATEAAVVSAGKNSSSAIKETGNSASSAGKSFTTWTTPLKELGEAARKVGMDFSYVGTPTASAKADLEAVADSAEQAAVKIVSAGTKAASSAKAIDDSFSTAAVPMRGMFEQAGGLNHVLRMMSFQLNQVAQSGAANGMWMQAAIVQIPDMLGLFGSLPLVLAGGVAALAGSFLPALISSSGAAKQLENDIDAVSESISALQAATSAGGGLSALRDEYGSLSERAQEFLNISGKIAQTKVTESIRSASRGISSGLGASTSTLDPSQILNAQATLSGLRMEYQQLEEELKKPLGISEIEIIQSRMNDLAGTIGTLSDLTGSGFAELADHLGITAEEAQNVAANFAALGQASGPREQAAAALDLSNYIFNASDNLADADDEGKKLYDQLVDVATKALEASKYSDDLASNTAAAADEAARLENNMPDFATRMRLSTGMEAYGGAQASTREAMQKLNIGGDLGDVDPAYQRAIDAANRAKSKSSTKEFDKNTREAAKWIEKAQTAAEKYAAELKDLNDLQEAGYLTQDQYAKAVALTRDEFNRTEFAEVYSGIQGISDAIGQNIGDWDGMRDAIGNVLKNIASDIISSGINSALLSVFGLTSSSGTSGLGSIVKSLFSFDGGGSTGDGSRSGGVDGKGGFAAILHPNETVVDHTKGQFMQSQTNFAPGVVFSEGKMSMNDDGTISNSFSYQIQQSQAQTVSKIRKDNRTQPKSLTGVR